MLEKLKRLFSKERKLTKIPDYESPIRSIVSRSEGLKYRPLKDFKEAKKYDDSYMILEYLPDDGENEVRLSIPVKLIKCDYESIVKLAQDLFQEGEEYTFNEDGKRCISFGIYFERMKPGQDIIGAVGGMTTESLWVGDELSNMKDKIFDVLSGKRNNIRESKKTKNPDGNKITILIIACTLPLTENNKLKNEVFKNKILKKSKDLEKMISENKILKNDFSDLKLKYKFPEDDNHFGLEITALNKRYLKPDERTLYYEKLYDILKLYFIENFKKIGLRLGWFSIDEIREFETCPFCNSKDLIKIINARPSTEGMRMIKEGKAEPGFCMSNGPEYRCRGCKKTFGKR